MSAPGIPSHWRPRTRQGRRAVVLFLAILALAQPPVVWWVANRIEPTVAGIPFLYVWLLVVYVLLNGVLIQAWRRGL